MGHSSVRAGAPCKGGLLVRFPIGRSCPSRVTGCRQHIPASGDNCQKPKLTTRVRARAFKKRVPCLHSLSVDRLRFPASACDPFPPR